MKPKWMCTSCGMKSSRHSNVQRHVRLVHYGLGNIVKDNLISGVLPFPYTMPSSNLFRGAVRKSEEKDPTGPLRDYITLFNEMKTFAANVSNNARGTNPWEDFYQQWFTISVSRTMAGIRGMVCERCLTTAVVPFFASANPATWGGIWPHMCWGTRNFASQMEHDEFLKSQNSSLIDSLVQHTNDWIKTEKYLYAREAAPIPVMSQWMNSVRVGQLRDDHYMKRAIMRGQTSLKEDELRDFISKARATYAICELEEDAVKKYYAFFVLGGRQSQ